MDISKLLLETSNKTLLIENIYFSNLVQNRLTKEQFIQSQENFINCINFWGRILGLLLANLEDKNDRKIIIELLNDEHGDITHVDSFIDYINKIGGKMPEKFDEASCRFNGDIFKVSRQSLIEFIATLGFIEFYYQQICTLFTKYLKTNFNLEKSHYSQQEDVSINHSMKLFKLLEKYDENKVKEYLQKGSNKACQILDDYYTFTYYKYCFKKVKLNANYTSSHIIISHMK